MPNKQEVFRITVVETAYFQKRAKSRMKKEEKGKAIEMIAKNPLCGDLMVGTGGVRKVRFAVGSKGKEEAFVSSTIITISCALCFC